MLLDLFPKLPTNMVSQGCRVKGARVKENRKLAYMVADGVVEASSETLNEAEARNDSSARRMQCKLNGSCIVLGKRDIRHCGHAAQFTCRLRARPVVENVITK